MMINIRTVINCIVASVLLGSSMLSHASDINRNSETDSYRIYWGIVPTSFIKQNPKLVDNDKSLHGGISDQGSTSYHVMLAIYDKDKNQRIVDATIITEVNSSYIGRPDAVKPLEKMLTSGSVTYGNYFNFNTKGTYEITARIYESDKSGFESFKFKYAVN